MSIACSLSAHMAEMRPRRFEAIRRELSLLAANPRVDLRFIEREHRDMRLVPPWELWGALYARLRYKEHSRALYAPLVEADARRRGTPFALAFAGNARRAGPRRLHPQKSWDYGAFRWAICPGQNRRSQLHIEFDIPAAFPTACSMRAARDIYTHRCWRNLWQAALLGDGDLGGYASDEDDNI